MPRRPPSIRHFLWPIFVAALIIAASHQPRLAGPEVVNIDKIAHFAVYGLLATLVCRLGHGWRAAVGALIATSVFGATEEWHQGLVPGREPEWGDWVADTVGAAVAVTLYWGWTHYRR